MSHKHPNRLPSITGENLRRAGQTWRPKETIAPRLRAKELALAGLEFLGVALCCLSLLGLIAAVAPLIGGALW